MTRCVKSFAQFAVCTVAVFVFERSVTAENVDFKQVQPILTKYCAGCHNPDDLSGELDVTSVAAIKKGGEHGAVLAEKAGQSKLIQVLVGQAEPAMPPEDEPKPNKAEIDVLAKWVNAGAPKSKEQDQPIARPLAPKIAPSLAAKPITALEFSPDHSLLAIARFKHVELRSAKNQALVGMLSGHAGKINSISFTNDGLRLIVASGVVGVRGEVRVWNLKTLTGQLTINGHRDIVYSAIASPDAKWIATASYDRTIGIWNADTGEKLRELAGHNGAVMDLDFSPDGNLLASASTDATIKIWQMATGKRLDTLSQPLKEQYSVAISADGQFVFGAGEDNRIRKWKLISRTESKINPILISRFGHEQSIENLALTSDGRFVVTASADRSVKIWDARSLLELKSFPKQTDSVQALAVGGGKIAIGRMDGSLSTYDLNVDAKQVATNSG